MKNRLIVAPLIISTFILLIIFMNSTSITGGASIGSTTSYSHTPANKVHDFFGVNGIVFPAQDCGDIAQGLYENIAGMAADDMTGFATSGPNRAATINFILDRIRLMGTLDLVKGSIVNDPQADSMISINTEAIARTPKEIRKTFFNMDLYGVTDQYFYVLHGRFSTPSLDCSFINQDGGAVCDCKVHSIRDIAVAGIPNPLRVELENPPPALMNLK